MTTPHNVIAYSNSHYDFGVKNRLLAYLVRSRIETGNFYFIGFLRFLEEEKLPEVKMTSGSLR